MGEEEGEKEEYDSRIVEGASMFIDFCASLARGGVSPSLGEMSPVSEEDLVVAQSRSVRIDALRRYQKKRARRSFKKVIRYECRKQTAINRPRTKGRFVKVEKVEDKDGVPVAG